MTLCAALLLTALAAEPAAGGPVLPLDQALKEAGEKNLDLRGAREKLVQTHELWRRVLANYLPQITVGGSYTRNQYEAKFSLPTGYYLRDMSEYAASGQWDPHSVNGPDWDPYTATGVDNPPGKPANVIMMPSGMSDMTIQPYDSLALQAKLQQALVLPALWPAFKLADLGEDLAKVSVENARREVLFGVLQLYYGCVGLKEVISIQERLLQNNLDHEKDARVRLEAGALPKIALIRAQIDRSKAEQDLQRAKMAYASAKVALGTLLDREGDFEVEHPAEPDAPQASPALLDQAQRDRLDLEIARRSQELAQKTYDSVWYKYAPNLVGFVTYTATNAKGFTGNYDSWAAGLQLGWTIWDGGLRESEQRENKSKVAEAELALKNAQNKARDEVRRALLDLESARSNRVKAEETVKLARENQQLVTVNYQAGAATQLEVSDANTALAAAELAAVSETLNAQLAVVKLVKAAGGFKP